MDFYGRNDKLFVSKLSAQVEVYNDFYTEELNKMNVF